MDFKANDVKEAFAKFLREQMQRQGFTVEQLAHKSGYTEKTIHNYFNPDKAPEAITDKFYTTMQTALQFQHQDFCQYYENHHVDQTGNIIGNVNITECTFGKTVFGAKEVHFHETNENTGN